ncbi:MULTISPECIES: tail fiber domain-containing protein [unclassified Sinorhizobium]|uniref:tail fiber domain-containing protein n=1 Tax=unclassified Sinorhizobium TaxID=2613772 RepID=UPI0035249CB4
MNMIDQYTPGGSLVYNQTGTQTVVGADGKSIQVPKYRATQTLSPEQQAILDKTNKASLNLADIAGQQSDFLKGYLAKPFEFNDSDASNWAYDLASQRILPQQQKNQEALRAQLVASGIRPGTAAYNSEMERLTQANSDQLNQLALNSRQQAYQEALTNRNQPINEISSLMSGSQIQNPNFVNTPQTQVGGVDYTGLVNNNYQAQVQQANSARGGLFGLLSAPFGMFSFGSSDRRLKRNIKDTGRKIGNLTVYTFNYLWDADHVAAHTGFMSDEVRAHHPEYVTVDSDNFDVVDYRVVAEAA